jgi:SAM-dependent methyltransferase
MVEYCSPITKSSLKKVENNLISELGESFPIVKDIPRFVESENYTSAFGLQWSTYGKTQLDSYTGLPISRLRLERCLGCPLSNLKNKDLLEAGCGPGRFTELFVSESVNTHSFDLSNAVETNYSNIGEKINYQIAQADIYNIPYPDHSFDVVSCLGVIQHTPDPEKTIEELFKKVKVGGQLVIDHYKWRVGYYTTLKPVYRFFFKKLKPKNALRIITKIADFLFPIFWQLKKFRWLHDQLNRLTPLQLYYFEIPDLSYSEHKNWCIMDTMDATTDHYKHLRTKKQILNMLLRIGGKDIWINEGGNGIEARCIK